VTYFFWTYLARAFGLLLLVPSLFPAAFLRLFPGLEDRRVAWVLFGVGISIYIIASIVFHIFKQRERRLKRAEMEELK
jgi:predicted membrane channel-forming protein YqfA (hemolysin III family)